LVRERKKSLKSRQYNRYYIWISGNISYEVAEFIFFLSQIVGAIEEDSTTSRGSGLYVATGIQTSKKYPIEKKARWDATINR